jgi:hypothetical protein
MKLLRMLLLAACSIAVVLAMSPASAETIWQKLQESSQEAQRRVVRVVNKPTGSLNPKNWTWFCPVDDSGPCIPAPGPD